MIDRVVYEVKKKNKKTLVSYTYLPTNLYINTKNDNVKERCGKAMVSVRGLDHQEDSLEGKRALQARQENLVLPLTRPKSGTGS